MRKKNGTEEEEEHSMASAQGFMFSCPLLVNKLIILIR